MSSYIIYLGEMAQKIARSCAIIQPIQFAHKNQLINDALFSQMTRETKIALLQRVKHIQYQCCCFVLVRTEVFP